MKNNKSVSAAIGEYLVLGEFLKRDFEAYLAHGETQKGWDALIIQNNKTRRIQVKTINWPKEYAINGKLTEGFDYLVTILLDRGNPRSRFFILPLPDLNQLISSPNKERKNEGRTLTMSKKAISGKLKYYEDNWDILRFDK